MRRTRVIPVLLCLLVLAGCVGLFGGDAQEASDSASLVTATPTALPTLTSTSTRTVTATEPPVEDDSSFMLPVELLYYAEDEAERYPSAQPPAELPEGFDQEIPGPTERECVTVTAEGGLNGAYRSGEFIAGALSQYVEIWPRSRGHGKIWWQPLRESEMDGLTVRATFLGSSQHLSLIYRSQQTAGSMSGASFYPSYIPLPVHGQWMLIATSGPDWGCFVMTLPSPEP